MANVAAQPCRSEAVCADPYNLQPQQASVLYTALHNLYRIVRMLSYQLFQVAIRIALFLLSSYYNLQTLATKPYAITVNAAFPKFFSISIIIF